MKTHYKNKILLIVAYLIALMPQIYAYRHNHPNYTFKTPNYTHHKKYDIITINTNSHSHTTTNLTLQDNYSHFYKKYNTNQPTFQNVTYNQITPFLLQSTPQNTPFDNTIETGNLSRVSRDETPNDPSVPIPAPHIPLILCTILWTITKYIKNKEKKTKFIS